jgi:hypothetical protein
MSALSRVVPATLVILLAAASSARAQEAETLRGRVVDAQNLGPVAGAFVAQPGSQRGVLTDSLGMFTLPVEEAYAREIRVVQMGYRELQAAIPEGGEGRVLSVLLVPDPVQLEGLTVLTERLADRRRGPYGVGEILTKEQLVAVSGGSAYDLVRRVMPFAVPCDAQTSEALCMGGRLGADGRRRVTVCIDDRAVPPELSETILSGVDPRALYMVESYNRVGEVRMYTPGYMQRLIDEDIDLPPLSFGCGAPSWGPGAGF